MARDPLTDVPDGPAVADRTGPDIPEVPAGGAVARPARGARELADPGPAHPQGRVDVPVRPGGGR